MEHLYEGRRNLLRPNLLSPNLIPHIQTFVKPYIPIAPIADYIPNIGVCQVYFVPK